MTINPQAPEPARGIATPPPGGLQSLTATTTSASSAWVTSALGGVLVLSVFLPWVTMDASLGANSGSGWVQSKLLLFTAAAVVIAGAVVATRIVPLWGIVVAAGSSLVHLIVTLAQKNDIHEVKRQLELLGGPGGGSVTVSDGFGLWISLLVSLGVIVWAIIVHFSDREHYGS